MYEQLHELYFSLSPLATLMNLCIGIFSGGGKLLFTASLCLSRCMNNYMNFVFRFLPLLLLSTCVLCSAGKLYFSLISNIHHCDKMYLE